MAAFRVFQMTQITAGKFAFLCTCSFKDAPFDLVVNVFLVKIEKKKERKTLGIKNPGLKNLSHISQKNKPGVIHLSLVILFFPSKKMGHG